ncbi:DUF3515 domain-containing protein [Streptomyces sp. AK02-01A]|uniref:DUF3515 domain-containing protein n=1 Tax=Streptomyces sp. AK02-01A TaxID=3028648 RepID=UPI0029A7887F|nr:DUF3515 domain-containing protein [Streptomyces sp. AK02-01A]MDX3854989.1 DUF3515 domain-containing protein [Streptomyces sp. AK02-01A]
MSSHRPLSRRRLSGRPLVCLTAVALLSAAVGCDSTDGAARVAVPSPPRQEAALCRALHKELPKAVAGLGRDDAEPSSELTAAWGDAAVVLRCGIPRPEELNDPQTRAVDVNGVNWMLEERDSGPRFVTTYRETYVEVTLSTRFTHDIGPLTDLAGPVARTVPSSL